jgi:dihydrofolate reductase
MQKTHIPFVVSLVAAMGGENRVIGHGGRIPWHIKADLEHFKNLTTGHAVIMGRKTFESIGRPLPKRTNIVVTRNADFSHEGIVVAYSLEDALEKAKEYSENKREIFIIGGAELYAQALPHADKLYLTLVEGSFEGDAFFPDIAGFGSVVSEEHHKEGRYSFSFIELERKR